LGLNHDVTASIPLEFACMSIDRLLPLPSLKPRALAGLAMAGSLLLGSLLTGTQAQAQVVLRPFYYGGTWSGPLVMPEPEGPRRLPLDALYEEIADQGYRPLGVIARARDSVTIEALDARNRRMRLTVDAYDGEILSRRPLATAKLTPQTPHVRPVPPPRQTTVRPKPEQDAVAPTPTPRRKTVEAAPKAAPPVAPAQGLNPAAPKAPSGTGPVAPARDPSQWGKQG
jgi:hypothetical protein